jgi:hypothetical protein
MIMPSKNGTCRLSVLFVAGILVMMFAISCSYSGVDRSSTPTEESQDFEVMTDGMKEARGKTEEKAEEAQEKAEEDGKEATESTESWAEWAKEKISETIGRKQDDAKEAAMRASDTASDTAKKAKDIASG